MVNHLYPLTYPQHFPRTPILILHPPCPHLLSDSYSTGHTCLGTHSGLLTQILNTHPHNQETHINMPSHNKHTHAATQTHCHPTHTHTHSPHTYIQSLSHKLNIKANTRIYTHQPLVHRLWSAGAGAGQWETPPLRQATPLLAAAVSWT